MTIRDYKNKKKDGYKAIKGIQIVKQRSKLALTH